MLFLRRRRVLQCLDNTPELLGRGKEGIQQLNRDELIPKLSRYLLTKFVLLLIFPSCHYPSPHMLLCSFELGSLNICGLLTQAGGRPEVLTESENFLFPLREKLKRSESGVISEALCCFFRVGGAQYAHHKAHKLHLYHDWASSPPSPMRFS